MITVAHREHILHDEGDFTRSELAQDKLKESNGAETTIYFNFLQLLVFIDFQSELQKNPFHHVLTSLSTDSF